MPCQAGCCGARPRILWKRIQAGARGSFQGQGGAGELPRPRHCLLEDPLSRTDWAQGRSYNYNRSTSRPQSPPRRSCAPAAQSIGRVSASFRHGILARHLPATAATDTRHLVIPVGSTNEEESASIKALAEAFVPAGRHHTVRRRSMRWADRLEIWRWRSGARVRSPIGGRAVVLVWSAR